MDLRTLAVLVLGVCLFGRISGVPTEEGIGCSACVETLQKFADNIIDELSSTDNVDLSQICKDAPAPFRSICQQAVSSFGKGRSPNMDTRYLGLFCKAIGQCGTKRFLGEESSELVFDAEIEPNMLEIVSASNVEGLPCLLCTNFMRLAQSFLKDRRHQMALFRLLKSACNFVPFIKAECQNLVSQYGWLIIHLAAQWVKPELCKLFHICTASTLVNTEDSCRVCEFSVGIIQDSLNDPALGSRLTSAMETFCEDIGNDAKTCKELSNSMADYLPEVIKTLRENAKLENLCQDSDICSKDKDDSSMYDSEESYSDELPWDGEVEVN